MLDEKIMNDNPEEVVEPQEEVMETEVEENYEGDDYESDSQELDEDEEVVEPQEEKKQQQSPEENAQFKKMRLKAESEARKQLEKERELIAQERLALQQARSEDSVYRNHVTQKKIEDLAYEKGVTEDVAKTLLEYEAKGLIEAEKSKVKEKFNQMQEVKRGLVDDEYFHLLEKEVDEVIAGNPEAEYEAVYAWLKHKKGKELKKQLASSVEKRTIANMHDRARRKNVKGSDGGLDENVSPSSVLSSEGMAMANAFGNDPREIAKYVKKNKKGR